MVPLGPVVLGIISGSQVEHMFIQCITKSNSPGAFLASPLSVGLSLMNLILWLRPVVFSFRRDQKLSKASEHRFMEITPSHGKPIFGAVVNNS